MVSVPPVNENKGFRESTGRLIELVTVSWPGLEIGEAVGLFALEGIWKGTEGFSGEAEEGEFGADEDGRFGRDEVGNGEFEAGFAGRVETGAAEGKGRGVGIGASGVGLGERVGRGVGFGFERQKPNIQKGSGVGEGPGLRSIGF